MKNWYRAELAKEYEFGEALEANLRDKLVCAVNDHLIQKRLLSEEKLIPSKKPLK